MIYALLLVLALAGCAPAPKPDLLAITGATLIDAGLADLKASWQNPLKW